MNKNLARYKEEVNARELLVQAFYELSFGHNDPKIIENSFTKNFVKTKVNYIFFKDIFQFVVKNKADLKKQIKNKAELEMFGILKVETMEENILFIALAEAELFQTPKAVLIDEGIRLSKKFGADSSYKFVNATLEKILN
jgi:N utilization substance protein B|tara:strand:+ start:39124 stop:39543 length:420 start_codon:yes stop_codon:yes gene_type:complete